MRKGSLFLRVLPFLLSVSVVALLGVSTVGFLVLRSLYYETNRYALSDTVQALANEIEPPDLQEKAEAQVFCGRAARGTSFRVTLMAPDGEVLGDSRADPADMENHANRPEMAGALAGKESFDIRKSSTTGIEMLYAAAPLIEQGRTVGVLRVSLEIPELQARLTPFYISAALGSLILLGAVALVSVRLGGRISRPIASLGETARAWASGDLSRRVERLTPSELDELGRTMNAMASDLAARISLDARRTAELKTVLDSIGEAVIAVDGSFRVRRANPAARLLSCAAEGRELEGLSLLEAFRNSALQETTERCAQSGERVEAEVSFYRETPRHFILCAAPLSGGAAGGKNPADAGEGGVVLVLNDITRLRRLEQVRRDFVANVSHELKTPITLIKGFVETLRDGALKDEKEAERFLGIIGRNADRMNALVEDLLTLARLERPDAPPLRREPNRIPVILRNAAAALEGRRAALSSELFVNCPEDMSADVNEGLLEQAVLNLADNALKYSGPGARVEISARSRGGFLEISVRDNGPGIPSRHLPRIFERFYRVDKARSREEGGTGLGLAIVRHIALAHGGQALVESREGGGSVFTIRLPLSAPSAKDESAEPPETPGLSEP